MLIEYLGTRFQVNRIALLVHVSHIVEKTGRASPATDDHVLKLGHLMQHVTLYLAETFLAHFVKQLFYRLAHTALYIPVQVIELYTQLRRQRPANGGLSRTHVANDDNPSHAYLLRR